MPLTCERSDDCEFTYIPPDDYGTLQKHATCSSCSRSMSLGDTVAVFSIVWYDDDGEDEYGADDVMCEECADLFFSLDELGFCVSPEENMKHLLKEYVELRAAGEFG